MSYASILRAPHAARTFCAALVGRLSYGVVFLSLVLSVVSSTGSYGVAGGCMALFGLTSAVLSPFRAALIDRRGLLRALPAMSAAYALLLTGLAVITWRGGVPVWVLLVLCAAAGGFTPPLGPIMRTLWRDLVERDLVQRAYSLDTVAEEVLYVTGPLLVGLVTLFAHPALGVALSAALVLIGTVALSASPVARASQQRTDDGPAKTTGHRGRWSPSLRGHPGSSVR